MYKLQDLNHVIKLILIVEQRSFLIFRQKWKKKDNYIIMVSIMVSVYSWSAPLFMQPHWQVIPTN